MQQELCSVFCIYFPSHPEQLLTFSFDKWKKTLDSEMFSNSPKGTELAGLEFKPRQPCSLALIRQVCPLSADGDMEVQGTQLLVQGFSEQEPKIPIQLSRSQGPRGRNLTSTVRDSGSGWNGLESSEPAPGKACSVPATALLNVEGSWRGCKEGAQEMVPGVWMTKLKGMTTGETGRLTNPSY